MSEREAVEIHVCPECWAYSLIARDGDIPHSADCSEPEAIEMVPKAEVSAAGQGENDGGA